MKKLLLLLFTSFLAFTFTLTAQTFTVLHSFTGSPDGGTPISGVAFDGTLFYGGTYEGGISNNGTFYSIAPGGSNYTTLQSFLGTTNGANEYTTPVVANGVLYATAVRGGTNGGLGVLVSMATNGGNLNVLHTFGLGYDGANPDGGLVLSGSTLYGTTFGGGSNQSGTLYSINTNGSNYTVLHNFNGDTNGFNPYYDQLIISGSTLYGATSSGGADYQEGVVFSISTNGSNYTVLHYFDTTNGADPLSGLILVNDTLYGTTYAGGAPGDGVVFSVKTNGTSFTVLHVFTGIPDGSGPAGGLVLGGTKIYGTTYAGGSNGFGSVFSVNLDGTAFDTIYSFSQANATNQYGVSTNVDGYGSEATLFWANGLLYGTTTSGGPYGFGNIFSLNPHPAFFNGEASLGNDVYYLVATNGGLFGYYNYDGYPYIYHYDLGYEYFFNANDGQNGAYLYDFTSGHFWYTTPTLFPYVYDFTLTSWLYYYPDTTRAGHYTASPRYFYDFRTSAIITE